MDVSPGTPAPAPNTDYWLLFHYYIPPVGGNSYVDIKVCLDREGNNVFYTYSTGIQYTLHNQRNSFYINGGQTNTSESMGGSNIEISVSNQFWGWQIIDIEVLIRKEGDRMTKGRFVFFWHENSHHSTLTRRTLMNTTSKLSATST